MSNDRPGWFHGIRNVKFLPSILKYGLQPGSFVYSKDQFDRDVIVSRGVFLSANITEAEAYAHIHGAILELEELPEDKENVFIYEVKYPGINETEYEFISKKPLPPKRIKRIYLNTLNKDEWSRMPELNKVKDKIVIVDKPPIPIQLDNFLLKKYKQGAENIKQLAEAFYSAPFALEDPHKALSSATSKLFELYNISKEEYYSIIDSRFKEYKKIPKNVKVKDKTYFCPVCALSGTYEYIKEHIKKEHPEEAKFEILGQYRAVPAVSMVAFFEGVSQMGVCGAKDHKFYRTEENYWICAKCGLKVSKTPSQTEERRRIKKKAQEISKRDYPIQKAKKIQRLIKLEQAKKESEGKRAETPEEVHKEIEEARRGEISEEEKQKGAEITSMKSKVKEQKPGELDEETYNELMRLLDEIESLPQDTKEQVERKEKLLNKFKKEFKDYIS